MKDIDKNKQPSFLTVCDINNLYRWEISETLRLGSFKWVNKTFQYIEDFIKHYYEDSVKQLFLEVDAKYPKILRTLYNAIPFLHERMKI